ncbi:3,4-dioxygenase subunit beta [Paractinoplanes abujensis]|uniref:Protocatechuate 3,4-dioxygenase beta subunit n=1 Tax=Paractinoplanes abujensis TaxID=882441 RepID=A0A7W7CY07_9ACTN|nr:intradiol ring-cleavage dioxygenase [Actinoplanes abujensis]MBB4695615.1 protocatechuate 3,4-dioxygenase beta subunit [Actinoplanes abujensis]GID23200.1 3,4-dioxygenase subunit beta [Actinoplanes abujensis]
MAQDTGPVYQGRLLPRPDEEVVDQGLGFDLGTLASRRHVLRGFGLGAAVLGLAACGSNSSSTSSSPTTAASSAAATGEIPDETAGPYPGDGSNGPDVLEESGVVRSDIRSSFGTASGTAQGVPMTLELTILDMADDDAPFKDVAVYVWHCDREGRYSLYSEGVTDQNYLRGVQIADDSGRVKFTSIFPACYSGRWPHIHFEVYPGQADITDSAKAIATSQVALPKDVCDKVYATTGYSSSVSNLSQISLSSDNVFGDDEAALQTGAVSGDVSGGFTVTLTVKVDTSTTPSGGSQPGGGGPGGAPPSR